MNLSCVLMVENFIGPQCWRGQDGDEIVKEQHIGSHVTFVMSWRTPSNEMRLPQYLHPNTVTLKGPKK